ncbi:MAG: mersacidin/lichenicidin family type 2 lantibiotic [Pirellulaceae bacterium]|nr:mersacidin/lichenicidin family type 2 lantibiotic [Planctomycetales bacterium]
MKNSKVDVVRAWKDRSYRNSLSDDERAALPANPAGMMELSDEELGHVVGGLQLGAINQAIDFKKLLTIKLSAVDACPSGMCPFDAVRIRFDPANMTMAKGGGLVG